MASEPSSERLVRAAKGEDKPLDEKQPNATFALVLGSYPIILVVMLLFLLLFALIARS